MELSDNEYKWILEKEEGEEGGRPESINCKCIYKRKKSRSCAEEADGGCHLQPRTAQSRDLEVSPEAWMLKRLRLQNVVRLGG